MKKPVNEDIQEGEIVESYWDVKKIAVGLVFLAIIIIAGSYLLKFFETNSSKSNVLGVSENEVKDAPPLPDKDDIENIIENAKESLSEITSENLTSSQAAIQRIITDLKSLQGESGAVGVICSLMCKEK
jgi:hypothetical protein